MSGVRVAAELTVRQHDERQSQARPYSGRCRQCGSDGCPLDYWARAVLAGRRALYPVSVTSSRLAG